MNIIINGIDINEIYNKIKEEIENYHLNKLYKNGKGQTKYLVEYLIEHKHHLESKLDKGGIDSDIQNIINEVNK